MTDINIRHLANLAQLQLSETEVQTVTSDLGRIIEMVDQMQSMDTDGVVPLAHPLDAHARLRLDAVTEAVDRDLYQSGAPETAAGLYIVPRVVE